MALFFSSASLMVFRASVIAGISGFVTIINSSAKSIVDIASFPRPAAQSTIILSDIFLKSFLKSFIRSGFIFFNSFRDNEEGIIFNPDSCSYTASKGAVLSMTRAMAVDYLEDKIRVNVICPGTTDTPSLAERIKSRGGSYEEVRQQYIERQRIGRLGTPEEIAEGVLFLVVNNFCTGVSLLVDGGMTM